MTLFIACLLIYHYDMDWWWYVIAAIIWMPHIAIWDKFAKRKFTKDRREVAPHSRGGGRGASIGYGDGDVKPDSARRASGASTGAADVKSDGSHRAAPVSTGSGDVETDSARRTQTRRPDD